MREINNKKCLRWILKTVLLSMIMFSATKINGMHDRPTITNRTGEIQIVLRGLPGTSIVTDRPKELSSFEINLFFPIYFIVFWTTFIPFLSDLTK